MYAGYMRRIHVARTKLRSLNTRSSNNARERREEQFSHNILLRNGNEYLFTQFSYNEKIDNFATYRGVFRGIGYFWFVARYQIPVRCNVLNQLKQSGA